MAVLQIEMMSNALKKRTHITAIIPIEQQTSGMNFAVNKPERLFPVIYLLHGFQGSDMDWLIESRIVSLAIEKRIAIIMPNGDNSFYLDDNSREQYYEQYISKELVEFSQCMFPISNKREESTIAGLSMGGFGALYNGLKHSDVFGQIFAFSSALIQDSVANMKPGERNEVASYDFYCHLFGKLDEVLGGPKDPKEMARMMVNEKKPIPKIFMLCGKDDFLLSENRDFSQYLSALNIPHEYRECEGAHEWSVWNYGIEEAIHWAESV